MTYIQGIDQATGRATERRFVGIELKGSYFEQAVKNLAYAEKMANAQVGLFSE